MGHRLNLVILKRLELTGNLSVRILVSLKVSVNLGVTVVSLNYMILLNKQLKKYISQKQLNKPLILTLLFFLWI